MHNAPIHDFAELQFLSTQLQLVSCSLVSFLHDPWAKSRVCILTFHPGISRNNQSIQKDLKLLY